MLHVAGWLQVGAGALVGAALFGMLTHQYDVGKPRREHPLFLPLRASHTFKPILTANPSANSMHKCKEYGCTDCHLMLLESSVSLYSLDWSAFLS